MAVKVTTSEVVGTTYKVVAHDKGTDFGVENGHLIVQDGTGNWIAAHAPGSWRAVEVAS